ncbi:hypothetical protein [Thermanaerothrix sp.]|jgi:hypothetical protein|uniref:hypothetical protein n=1 Tax=Thermanaerothrix sp. TaxID=2972675 RepID=UPI002ADE8C49|nr:hypothetical protein [Thermanaerothrix sp.]
MATASPKDLTAEQIWTVQPGERRSVGVIHIVILALLIGIGFVVGAFGSISFPLGFGVNFFWTGIAVQQVGGIWFGGWGVLAGAIFPFFSNAIAGTPFYVSLGYVPANAVQAFLPAWAFRYFKADPRLKSGRDYLILFLSMLVANAFGALWSPLVVLRGFGLLTTESVPLFVWGWFGGNMVAGIVFNFILLKALSGVVIRTPAFVKRWWA